MDNVKVGGGSRHGGSAKEKSNNMSATSPLVSLLSPFEHAKEVVQSMGVLLLPSTTLLGIGCLRVSFHRTSSKNLYTPARKDYKHKYLFSELVL